APLSISGDFILRSFHSGLPRVECRASSVRTPPYLYSRNLTPETYKFFSSRLVTPPFLIHFHPTDTIFRLTNAICVASGTCFGPPAVHAIGDMQPNTPSSSPISS